MYTGWAVAKSIRMEKEQKDALIKGLYKEKLKNPKWQALRLRVFERDHFCCVRCGEEERELHVHHLDYIPGIAPHMYPMDMLRTLCDLCHEKENERDKIEKYLYNTLKMKGFSVYDLLALSCKVDTEEDFTKALLRVLRKT